MRKLLIIPLMCLLTIAIHAQTTKNIHLSYSANEFTFADNDGITTISSPQHLLLFESDTLAPALPYILVNVYLSENTEYTGFTYSKTESVVRTNVTLPANQIEYATSTDPLPVVPVSTGYPSGTYPDISIENTGVHKSGKYKFASFKVFPFKYDTATQQLYLATSIDLTISLDSIAEPVQSGGNFMGKSVKRIVTNPEDVTNVPDSSSQQNYEYVIITNSTLQPVFQKLADWKTKKGVRTKVLTTEEVSNRYSGETMPLKIKNALYDYYEGEYSGLKYALLGGDDNIVPVQYCYIQKNDTTNHKYTPTDIFYSCFGNMNWDTNHNGIAGEISDSVDISPEIIISRISVRSIADANSVVDRIINYESNPKLNNWQDNILMTGAQLKMDLGDMSDAQNISQQLYTQAILPYWTGSVSHFYDTYTDFEGGADYDLTSSHLQTELENGYSIINICSHGGVYSIDMESGNLPYNTTKAKRLNNPRYSILTTTACHTNAFDSAYTCLSEAFIRNQNSGILAYVGSSREGFTSTSYFFNLLFYRFLLSDNEHQLGKAVMEMKNALIGSSNTYDDTYRWLHFAINMLGDPEMPLYVEKPKKFENVTIAYNDNGVVINSGIDSCRICIMSSSDSGQSLYHVKHDTANDTIQNINDDTSICITKPGYIPYVAIINTHCILQHEDIDGDMHILADEVSIGSDITTDKEYGPVTISNGETTIQSKNGVTIKNDFSVNFGAQFSVINE